MGGRAEAAHDSDAIAASVQDAFTPSTVSVKQMLEPAQTVLSSSVITGEGKGDFNRLAYHSLDASQSGSLPDVRDASNQGEGAVTTAREVVLPDARIINSFHNKETRQI